MSSPSVLDKSSVIQLDERPSSEEHLPTSSRRYIKLMVCYESSTESQGQRFISGMFVSSLMITWMKDVPCLFLTVSKFLCTFTVHHLLSALYYLHVSNSQLRFEWIRHFYLLCLWSITLKLLHHATEIDT